MKACDWIFVTLLSVVALTSCGGSDSKEDSNYDDSYSWKDGGRGSGDEPDNSSGHDTLSVQSYAVVEYTPDINSGSSVSDQEIEEIVRRYQSGTTTVTDFNKCLDYFELGINAFTKEFENIIDNSNNVDDVERAIDSMEPLFEARYPLFDSVVTILENSSAQEMGSENSLRYQRLIFKLNQEVLSIGEKAADKFGLKPEDMGEFAPFS